MVRDRPDAPEGDYTRAVLEAAIAAVPSLFRAEGCAVLLPSAERETLRAVARRGLTEPQAQALAELLMHREAAAALADGRPFLPREGAGLSPGFREQVRADGWPDLVAVPLPGTGRPVGALAIVPDGDGRWSPAKVRAASDLGALVGVALRSAVRATDSERRRRRAATLLERLPLIPDRGVDLDDALGRIVAGIGDALGVTHCLGVLFRPQGAFAEFCQPGVTPIGRPAAPERHPMWRLLGSGGIWSYDDAEASSADRSLTSALLNGAHPRAVLAVPVQQGRATAGFLVLVQADRRRRFTDDERGFIVAAAGELAVMLETPAAETNADEQASDAAGATALAGASAQADVAEILTRALGESGAALNALILTCYDTSARRLHFVSGVIDGAPAPTGRLQESPLGDDLLSDALRNDGGAGGPASRGLPRTWRAMWRPPRSAQALAVPAGGSDVIRYVVLAAGPEAALAVAAPRLRALAPTVGLTLQRSTLIEQATRRERRLAALNEVLLATSVAPDVTVACSEAAATVCRDVPNVDLVNVWLIDEDITEILRVASVGPSMPVVGIADRFALDSDSGVARVVRRQATEVWHVDSQSVPAGVRDLMERAGLQSVVTLPMRTARGISGALTLGSRTRRPFQSDELTFLETLAGQLGAQLEIVRLRERADVERRRLGSILQTLPEALLVIGSNEVVQLANPVAKSIMGEADAGQPLRAILAGAQLRNADGHALAWEELPFIRALAGEQATGVELLLIKGDGAETPLLVNCRPVQEPTGAISAAVCVFQDLTPLRELSMLKNDFVNTVSHELRTPITTIRGGALTLLKRRQYLDEGTQSELLNDIAEEAERLHTLVEDLLSLTRSRSGINVQPEPVLLGRLINRVITELGGRVGGHTVQIAVPSDLPPVDADPVLAQKVVRNLLENAVKFSPRGQAIEVTAETSDGAVVVSVLDRGSGVPPEDLDRLFEPFYRPDATVRSGAQGAGLGLAVCRRLAEMQGGRIWAEPREGGGAVFRFTLPIAEADD